MKKILVIEDNEEIRENLEELLILNGYDVRTAENGQHGVKEAMTNIPDLIVCDVMMPVLDGYGVLKIISQNDQLKHIPFLFLTAKDQQEDFRQGMRLGADDYIAKPFKGLTILEAIETRLKKYESLQPDTDTVRSLSQLISKSEIDQAISILTEGRVTEFIKSKEVLVKEGALPRWVYFIKQGRLLTTVLSTSAKDFISDIHIQGDFVGYESSVLEQAHQAKITADIDSEVLKIPQDDFIEALAKVPALTIHFMQRMASSTMLKRQKAADLLYSSVRLKVAWSLIKLNKHMPDEDISMTKKDIAKLSGITPESVFRSLSDFQDEGIIEINDGLISLINVNKLKDLIS